MREDDLPPEPAGEDEYEAALRADEEDDLGRSHSLTDDLAALIDDGRTYAEAEMAFQKTRMAFAAKRGKSVALYGIAAFAFLHLALIGLVIGAIIALTPLVGAFGATGIVVVVLLIGGFLLVRAAQKSARELSSAYSETKETGQ